MKRIYPRVLSPLVFAALLVFAQPNYEVGPLLFMVSNRGVVRISGEGFSAGTGSLMSWGPAWLWQDACSWQDSWSLVSGPKGSKYDFEVECYAKCDFATFRPKVRYWFGRNGSLIEINVTAVADSSLSGMSWTLQLPIDRFAGRTIFVISPSGSKIPVTLREHHVPGQAGFFSIGQAAGWVIPVTDDAGLVLSVLTDLYPQGVPQSIDDEREWAGGTYALRNWLGQQFQIPADQTLRFIVVLYPYKGDPSPYVSKVVSAISELARGASLEEVKTMLINDLGIEQGQPMKSPFEAGSLFVVLFAAAASILLFLILVKKRRS